MIFTSRIYDEDGYILLRIKDHPNSNPNGYIREHRVVLEESLGRLLRREELVHHVNGVRDDNRIENLLLLSSQSEHLRVERDSGKRIGRSKLVKDFMCRCGSGKYYAKNSCHKCYDHLRNANV